MREYRAMRKDNGEWVYGNLVTTKHFTFVLNTSFIPALSLPSKDFIEVNPETIGQFIGFKDVKGNKIYEGDITSKGYEIRFCQEKCLYAEFSGDRIMSYPIDCQNIEIIGNIHRK